MRANSNDAQAVVEVLEKIQNQLVSLNQGVDALISFERAKHEREEKKAKAATAAIERIERNNPELLG